MITVLGLVLWSTFFGVSGFAAGLLFSQREMRSDLVCKVRDLLNTDTKYPLNVENAARELRTLLALDGHRLPKHVRDAVSVWLAERESS